MKNSFVFNETNYLQVHGTAMGTRTMAPSYANVFMGKLERKFLQTQDRIPRVWWRYIDDTFAIWDHGEPYVTMVNHLHGTIVNHQPSKLQLRCQLKKCIGANRPETPGTIPDFERLSRVPPGN